MTHRPVPRAGEHHDQPLGDEDTTSSPGPRTEARPPRYLDETIADFESGAAGQHNHLGHWDDPSTDPLGTSRTAAQERMNEVIIELAGISDGSHVLDVGCGFGGTIDAINRRFSTVRATGLDIDIRQLTLNRRLVAERDNSLGWVNAGASELPFPDETFDHILSIEAMWHFPSRERFLGEVARTLRPGGRLAVVDILIAPDADARMGRPRADLLATLERGFAPWPEPGWSVDDSELAAGRHGLTIAATIDATEHTKPTYLDHGDAEARPSSARFSATDAVRLFVDMHLRDALRVVYLAFERPAP